MQVENSDMSRLHILYTDNLAASDYKQKELALQHLQAQKQILI